MDGVGYHDDSSFRPNRAGLFTGTATDTEVGSDFRNTQVASVGYHVNGLSRTNVAKAAPSTTTYYNAAVRPKLRYADLYGLLFLSGERKNSPVGTNVGASCTPISTKRTIEVKHRHGKTVDAVFRDSRTNYTRRASNDASVTGRAMVFKVS